MSPDADYYEDAQEEMNVGEERVIFFCSIGEALAQWAYMEAHLQKAGSLSVPFLSRPALIAGIASIENFRARVQFVDEMLAARFAEHKHFPFWLEVRERLDKAAPKRNRLAHNVPVMYPNGEIGRRYALEEWGHEPTHHGTRPSTTAICLKRIIQLRREFHQLTTDLVSVQMLLEGGHRLPPEFDTPADSPPAMRHIRDLIRGGFGLPRLEPRAKKRKRDKEQP